MTKRIFRGNFLCALMAGGISALLVTWIAYVYFINTEETKLLQQAQITAQGFQQMGLDFLQDLPLGDMRITWLDQEGIVLYDTHSPVEEMEHHGDREEIISALLGGVGTSRRHSETLFVDQIYTALRLEDGTVVRISTPQDTLMSFFVAIFQPLMLVLLLGAGASGLLAHHLSRKVIEPLNFLDLEHPLKNATAYEEITPLLSQIQRQYQKIDLQVAEMHHKQEEFYTITQAMTEGLLLLHPDGQIININDSAAILFGVDKQGSVGQNILTVHRSPQLQTLLKTARKGQRAEGVIPLVQGQYQVSVSPIIPQKDLSALAVLVVNVTEKDLADKMRREFTANVSHELRTPLHSISGCAELMCNNLVQWEDIPQFAQQIYSEAQRLIRLVDEIISLSRLDEGVDIETAPLDLGEIAHDVVHHLSSLAEKNQVALSYQGDSGKMTGNSTMMAGIVRNLCENAIKYNRPQGKVMVQVSAAQGVVRLRVEDTGIGIPEADQDLIFQRFYRVDKSRSKEIGGTGLGLSIVKHTVGLHQGTISLHSVEHQGTTIEIQFPQEK